jgi:C-terminal processing protease CtpA/Prc
MLRVLRWGILLVVLAGAVALLALEDVATAPIVNDEGGPVHIVGVLPIANPNVKLGSVDPVIILEDQAGFVDRNFDFTLPEESQVLARYTSDFYAPEPVTYELALPIVPQGSYRDVDHDNIPETGVQIFQVAYWDNRFGDLYLDDRDAYGWSGAYSSAKTSDDPRQIGEIMAGKLIVYAPDAAQGFPAGFGTDQKLFTADDPIVLLPAGYTVVDLDTDPFTFDRSRRPTIDLIEPEGNIPDDFSQLSYPEAFDALVEKARNEYVFTELKGINWDDLHAAFRPLFEEAERNNDADAYQAALYRFSLQLRDGHVLVPPTDGVNQQRLGGIASGVGLAVRELTDGRILVNFVLENSPADQAGIEFGAEILAINGKSIQEAIDETTAVNVPYSSAQVERLDKVRFVLRFPPNSQVDLTYRNPGSGEATANLTSVDERNSLSFSRQFVYGAGAQNLQNPVEFVFLPTEDGGNYGYLEVNDFYGNEGLIIANWEYFLSLANQAGAPGIIIDLRYNLGGFSSIGFRMAGYLHNEAFDVFYNEEYNQVIDDFFHDPRFPAHIEPEPDETKRYQGEVVVLVGPACASACEVFAYALAQRDRSTIMGQYGTAALGGGWFDTYMPEDIVFPLPTSRKLDLRGNIIIEDTGIQPTVVVPVTEDNMASTDDVILQAAIEYLNQETQ